MELLQIAITNYLFFACSRMAHSAGTGRCRQLSSILPLGPYQAVLDNWRRSEHFGDALRCICDYHCQSIVQGDPRYDPWPPFNNPPFDLVPYEILAIYKLRRAGLGDTRNSIIPY
ncbi:MAG: hypothetical protein R3C10_20760 [Pirellulales bacterium]